MKGNPRYKDVNNYSDVYPHVLKEITHFFSVYKDLEGKDVEVKGWKDAAFAAKAIILEARAAYEEKHKDEDRRQEWETGGGKRVFERGLRD